MKKGKAVWNSLSDAEEKEWEALSPKYHVRQLAEMRTTWLWDCFVVKDDSCFVVKDDSSLQVKTHAQAQTQIHILLYLCQDQKNSSKSRY